MILNLNYISNNSGLVLRGYIGLITTHLEMNLLSLYETQDDYF